MVETRCGRSMQGKDCLREEVVDTEGGGQTGGPCRPGRGGGASPVAESPEWF